jgi:hypothetical protein
VSSLHKERPVPYYREIWAVNNCRLLCWPPKFDVRAVNRQYFFSYQVSPGIHLLIDEGSEVATIKRSMDSFVVLEYHFSSLLLTCRNVRKSYHVRGQDREIWNPEYHQTCGDF